MGVRRIVLGSLWVCVGLGACDTSDDSDSRAAGGAGDDGWSEAGGGGPGGGGAGDDGWSEAGGGGPGGGGPGGGGWSGAGPGGGPGGDWEDEPGSADAGVGSGGAGPGGGPGGGGAGPGGGPGGGGAGPGGGPGGGGPGPGGGPGGAGGFGGAGGGGGGAGGAGAAEAPVEPEPPPEPERPMVVCGGDQTTTLYLSADDSNSQASPVLARRAIREGRHIPPRVIRTYEFLNYADFDYAAPAEGLAIYPEMRPVPGAPEQYALQIGVRAPDLAAADVRPLHVVLVLDSSGSMAGQPLALLRHSVRALVARLRDADRVSAVRLDARPEILLDAVPARRVDVDDLLQGLVPNGATALEAALRLAYDRATTRHRPGELTRVVLLTDGGANAGQTSVDLIARHAGDAQEDGIHLIGAGMGEGFNDTLLDAVTDAGKGAYFYVDSAEEAERMFGDRFVSNFEVAALDVEVELTLPPSFGLLKFHGEEVARVPGVVRPQNLAPSDQMVFHQILGTCTPDALTGEETFSVVVQGTDPRTGERHRVEHAFALAPILGAPADNLALGEGLVAFAEGIRALSLKVGAPRDDIDETCVAATAALAAAGPELEAERAMLATYCDLVAEGERHPGACDCGGDTSFTEALGLCGEVEARRAHGARRDGVAGAWRTLGDSMVRAREGCSFAAISTGIVGEASTIPGENRGCNGGEGFEEPIPGGESSIICDLAQVTVTLTAPRDAHSFSFDFDFFSAEFPEFIGSAHNDTFLAIIEAESTRGGRPTNISFDAQGMPIEINNNYFANPYHPCSEAGTGFVRGASTCWLRTSWPIEPGETFRLTFSVHDEGDPIYSSTVLLDHFRFHPEPAVGMTDPLN